MTEAYILPLARRFGDTIFISVLLLLLPLSLVADEPDKGERDISIAFCELHTTHKFAMETVREAYHKIGLHPTFVSRPCKRSLVEANSGKFDAELARIPGIDKKYTNLVAAAHPTILVEGIVVTKYVDRAIESWSDLQGLTVGIIRGEVYAEKGTAGMKVTQAPSYSALLSMLVTERVEVAVVIRRDFELVLKSPEFWGENIHAIGKPVFQAPLFHLVHEKNKDLLEDLNPVFAGMWDSGEAQEIHDRTAEMLSGNSH